MRIYVAGPMSGLPNYNFTAFDWATMYLRSLGHEVFNPAEHDREAGYVTESFGPHKVETTRLFTLEGALRWDLARICESDAIALLPGWETSTGAAKERFVAEATGCKILLLRERPFHTTPGLMEFRWEFAEEQAPLMLGLSGYARTGKDALASILVEQHGFERIAFADALRDMLIALNPLADATPAFSQDVLGIFNSEGGWDGAKKVSEQSYYSVRSYLQRLGTEAGRVVLGENVWVDAAMKKVKPGGRYVFTDCRFPSEAKAIEARGGKIVRVKRQDTGPVNGHPSEVALDDWNFAAWILNFGSLDALALRAGRLATMLAEGRL